MIMIIVIFNWNTKFVQEMISYIDSDGLTHEEKYDIKSKEIDLSAKNIKEILRDLARITKPNQYLIVRPH